MIKEVAEVMEMSAERFKPTAKLTDTGARDIVKSRIEELGKLNDIKAEKGETIDHFPKEGVFREKVGDEVRELKNVDRTTLDFTKRPKEEVDKLHYEFYRPGGVREEFIKDLATNQAGDLKKMGLNDDDIKYMKETGHTPKNIEVHHKRPLDDSGTNSLDNLILIKRDEHNVFTVYQNRKTDGMKVGDTKKMDWPMPRGNVYTGR